MPFLKESPVCRTLLLHILHKSIPLMIINPLNKLPGPVMLWIGKKFFRRPFFQNDTVGKENYTVRHISGKRHLMGHDNQGCPLM